MPGPEPRSDQGQVGVDYSKLIKRLDIPPGFSTPTELAYEDLRAHAITREDLHDDVQGINASLELIRATRGGRWPSEPVSEEHNYVDLVWHELEFREGDSLTYVLRDSARGYLGCCYFYPMGRRKPLTERLLVHDVDVSWWVTPDAYRRGYYVKAFRALRGWATGQLPFRSPYFSNAEIPPG